MTRSYQGRLRRQNFKSISKRRLIVMMLIMMTQELKTINRRKNPKLHKEAQVEVEVEVVVVREVNNLL